MSVAGRSVLQGTLAFVLVAAIHVMALQSGIPVPEVLAFFSLVVVIVSLILVKRSFSTAAALKRQTKPACVGSNGEFGRPLDCASK
ncbi:hypothetical protein [Bradyrhizobium sp. LMTR 3]|uniref:hypothetical protein n=1 Tax=Bradyrhizobium sp. LMTR 3 TaxID=189873 RepID=UPI000810997D|nr:hypothetical protein [Bradyrhizobium sp. LMTR 3]OCK53615.1 hypothetical protein LMTR3_28375 [Bradyrhizobium sp. LMTR 3]